MKKAKYVELICLIILPWYVHGQNAAGLLADYPLDNSAVDKSGNNFHGVVNNVIPIADRFNRTNKALYFNGYSSNVEIFKQFPDLSELTISFWIKLKSNSANEINTNRTYIFWEGDAFCGHDVAVGLSDSKIFIIGDKTGGVVNGINGTAEVDISNEQSTLNGWYFFTWTMTPTVSKLYLNGSLKSIINSSGSGKGYHFNPTLGCLNDGNKYPCGTSKNSFFEGALDEVKIFSVAQTSTQVYNNFKAASFSGAASSFIGLPIYEQRGLVIYPNPVSGNSVHIEIASEIKIKGIRLFNIIGVGFDIKYKDENSLVEIDCTGFPTGVYFLEIEYVLNDQYKKVSKKININ